MAWIRQCELDARREELPPIPTRIASNEEFIPPPQSPEQREVELRLWAIAETAAGKLGLSRRDFLRTGCGMAAAFVAMNQVFGPCYEVEADEPTNPEKVRETLAQGPVHLRRADAPRRCQRQVVRRHAARANGFRTSSARSGPRPRST